MTTATTTTPLGAPNWIDLATSDLASARRFYGAVFGWTFDVGGPDTGGYVTALLGGKSVGGLTENRAEWNTPDGWTTYLHTADIDATLATAAVAGGPSCSGAMDIPGRGRMAILSDPTGGRFGLWQPAGHNGFEVTGTAGSPVYHQLFTRDFTSTLGFYAGVFGWQVQSESDTDEFRYSNAVFNGEPLLGVMDGTNFLPADAPSDWTFFLGAEDVDKTVATVLDNGGSVVRAPEDTPYGRLAAVADPTGAGFNLSSLQD